MSNQTQTEKAPLVMTSKGVSLESFEQLWRFAQCIAKSPFAPKGMETPEAIVPAIQLGLEIGLSPMAALQNVAVINGRPGIYGDAALALVRASGLCESYTQKTEGAGDTLAAVVASKRNGHEPLTHRFSVSDAKKAGLWGKSGPWSQYPERMLLFRARGFNLRDNFGDVLKGLRTTEELSDIPVEKVVSGHVVQITPLPSAQIALCAELQAPLEEAPIETQPEEPRRRHTVVPKATPHEGLRNLITSAKVGETELIRVLEPASGAKSVDSLTEDEAKNAVAHFADVLEMIEGGRA
jgi:hypothetical protein